MGGRPLNEVLYARERPQQVRALVSRGAIPLSGLARKFFGDFWHPALTWVPDLVSRCPHPIGTRFENGLAGWSRRRLRVVRARPSRFDSRPCDQAHQVHRPASNYRCSGPQSCCAPCRGRTRCYDAATARPPTVGGRPLNEVLYARERPQQVRALTVPGAIPLSGLAKNFFGGVLTLLRIGSAELTRVARTRPVRALDRASR